MVLALAAPFLGATTGSSGRAALGSFATSPEARLPGAQEDQMLPRSTAPRNGFLQHQANELRRKMWWQKELRMLTPLAPLGTFSDRKLLLMRKESRAVMEKFHHMQNCWATLAALSDCLNS